jgi:DNA-binding transcriptional ArsR family regulator
MVNNQSSPLDATFAALADPTRRAILLRLSEGEASVSELAEPFVNDMSLPAISKHLSVLERAGMINRRKEGRTHHITLAAKPMQEAASWLEFYRRFWDDRFDALDDLLSEDS